MVDLSAFRAIRYDSNKVGDLSKVLAPPYDVIDEKQQDALYAQHPQNIVRIDLTKIETSDHPLARYERAKESLAEWMASGVLATDEAPALYVLAQTFTGPDGIERTRTGFFSRARLVHFDERQILPHERTLRGPKVDRLNLYRATKTNLSPIFGAYHDADGEIARQLGKATKDTKPVVDARMGTVVNRLWMLTNPQAIAAIEKLFGPKKLYIADGHHRYETGLAYRDERRVERGGGIEPNLGYEHILMFASAIEDPGMVIFPTHRLVHTVPGFDGKKLETELARFFTLSPVSSDPKEARAALAKHQDKNAFIAILRGGARHLLVARDDAPLHEIAALGADAALGKLDVSILHSVILESILGISKEAQATQQNLRYSKDFAEAMGAVERDPSVDVAFLMNPTKIEEVTAVADAGGVMPQKSTFFYPKIPTGLVLYDLG